MELNTNLPLKDALKEEIKHVTKLLCECDDRDHIARCYLKSWLLSLQRLDKICEDRNRY